MFVCWDVGMLGCWDFEYVEMLETCNDGIMSFYTSSSSNVMLTVILNEYFACLYPQDDPPIHFKADSIPSLNHSGGIDVVARAVTYCSKFLKGEENKGGTVDNLINTTQAKSSILGRMKAEGDVVVAPDLVLTPNNVPIRKKPTMIRMVRNDVLSVDDRSKVHELAWFKHLKKWNIKVLILNTGAHFRSDKKFRTGLKKTLDAVRLKYHKMLIIYRSTPKGNLSHVIVFHVLIVIHNTF